MQTKSLRNAKALVAASAMLILLGSGVAFAADQKTFHSGYEFQVYDPAEPVVDTAVTGNFIDHVLTIQVNMSAHEGVKQLKGTYSAVIEIWNDTQSAYVPYATLVSGKSVTLTTHPLTTEFTFKTSVPGTYNVHVTFIATSVDLG